MVEKIPKLGMILIGIKDFWIAHHEDRQSRFDKQEAGIFPDLPHKIHHMPKASTRVKLPDL